jgi:hypothetical protein
MFSLSWSECFLPTLKAAFLRRFLHAAITPETLARSSIHDGIQSVRIRDASRNHAVEALGGFSIDEGRILRIPSAAFFWPPALAPWSSTGRLACAIC